MATLAQQPGGMRKMRRSHSAGRRRQCPGRWKDSVAVYECGFCLAAGWDTDPAKQPRVRTEAVSRQPGDKMSPILPLVPACPPARRAENGRGGCSGHGPTHELPILSRAAVHSSPALTCPLTRLLTCSGALGLPPSLATISGVPPGGVAKPRRGSCILYLESRPTWPSL